MSNDEVISYADAMWNDFSHNQDLIHTCVEQTSTAYAVPRNFTLSSDFVCHHLPGGRMYLYGAGTHSQSLLPILEQRSDIELLGIVDMHASDKLKQFFGYTVVSPANLNNLKFDFVLLSHADREPEMASALRLAGIEDKKILWIYGSQEYKNFVISKRDEWPALSNIHPTNVIIISTANPHNCLIPDHVLQNIFSEETTLELFMGRPTEWNEKSSFKKINMFQSLMLLDEALGHAQPKLIYFRNTAQASLPTLPIYLREHYPNIPVVHETYDLGSFIEDERLRSIWGFSDESIRQERLGEIFSFRYGEMFVHKNIGSLWDTFAARCETQSLVYFPGVCHISTDDMPIQSKNPGHTNIVYPAGLSPYGNVISPDIRNTLELLDTVQAVAKADGANIHLYNHYHRSPDDTPLFQYYIDRFAETSVHYHSYVPHATLLKEISQFDFGWLYFEESPALPRENLWRIGLPNKFTDYVQAGLPTIVTDAFSCVAEIVEKYNAGIVIPSRNPEQIAAKLKLANIDILREGTKRLRHDMQKSNQRTIEHLKQLVYRSSPSSPS